MEVIAKSAYARDHWDPIPTEPGFAFEGGFLKRSGNPWRAEKAIVTFDTLPPYLGIGGDFVTFAFEEVGEPMLKGRGIAESLVNLFSGVSVLRKGDVTVDGRAAQELCAASTEEGRRVYEFEMKAPSQGKDLARPMLLLDLSSDRTRDKFGNYKFRNGFASDAEAVEVWNALRDSIRLRPGAV